MTSTAGTGCRAELERRVDVPAAAGHGPTPDPWPAGSMRTRSGGEHLGGDAPADRIADTDAVLDAATNAAHAGR